MLLGLNYGGLQMIDLKYDMNISETLYRRAQNSPHTPNFDNNSEIYLHGYETITAARTGLKRFFDSHNVHRQHSTLGVITPGRAHFDSLPLAEAA